MAVNYTTWLWGTKYAELDVIRLADSVRRNTGRPFRFICFTDKARKFPAYIEQAPIPDMDLIGRGCFCRLRVFDPEFQKQHSLDEQIIGLDLDAVIVANVDPVFHRSEDFLILQGVNAVNPNPFNCSVTMLRAGKHPEVWKDFSLEKTESIKYHEFPDDQGWLWHVLPKAYGWKAGETSGVYGFKKPGWPGPDQYIPRNARIIAFIGRRKPQYFTHLGWVQQHWRTGL